MIRKRILLYMTSLLFSCLILTPSYSQDDRFFKKESPVEITADSISYNRENRVYIAEGNVEIKQDSTILWADRAMLDMTSGIATAYGNVRAVDEGGNILTGKSLHIDIRDKKVRVKRGRIFFKEQNVYIEGEVLAKTGRETYSSTRTYFTTCDCPEGKKPAWSFYLSSSRVTVGEFLTGWHAFFNIKGIPVLYSPYVKVPVKRKRQTGFLPPKPGYSRLRGAKLDNAFFWAIADNMDATFYLDVETKRGLGKGVEFRYIRKRSSYGELFFYLYKEKDIDRVREFRADVDNLLRPMTADDDRWQVKFSHSEYLPMGITLKADINIVSDDEYFIDFGKDTLERSYESLESTISFSKSWSSYSLVGEFRRFDNLLLEDDTTVLQMLPILTFTRSSQRLIGPFYFSMDSTFVNFERNTGVEGQRLDVRPKISLPLRPGGYFEFTPSFTPRATFYWSKKNPEGRYIDRYLYEVKADLTTTFVRIFSPDLKELKLLRHTIRPKLTYTYIPQADQYDLPSFDGEDRIPFTNQITYSLNTTLTGKFIKDGRKSYHDYLYMDISQTYDIYEATRRWESDTVKRRPFSDIFGEIILKPTPASMLTARGVYDVYERWFENYDTSMGVGDGRGDRVDLSYRYIRDETRYLEARVRIKTIKPLDFIYFNRYSFNEEMSIETSYGLEYTHQCWGALLTYTDRLEEKIIFLTFNLRGLGDIAGFRGRLEGE